MVKVAIYEDNDSLRQALSVLIGGTPDYELTGVYEHCRDLETDLAANRPDVVLMDIDLPGRSGIEGVVLIRKHFPGTEALMLTVFDDDERVFQAVCAGASGYLLKKTPPAKILEAIREVQEGGAPMTPVIARKVLQLFPGKPAATQGAQPALRPGTGGAQPPGQRLPLQGHRPRTGHQPRYHPHPHPPDL